ALNADSRISDFKLDAAFRLSCRDFYRASFWSKLYGVGEQIPQYLPQFCRVGGNFLYGTINVGAELNAFSICRKHCCCQNFLYQGIDLYRSDVERSLASYKS